MFENPFQVERVAKQYQDHPTVVKPIMDSIDAISKSCLAILDLFKDQNLESRPIYERLGSLIDYNQVRFFVMSLKLISETFYAALN